MRIEIDPWLCQGHLRCVETAPALFRWNDELNHAELAESFIGSESAELVRRAVGGCPEGAVRVVEADVS